jgi:hypothetical protein
MDIPGSVRIDVIGAARVDAGLRAAPGTSYVGVSSHVRAPAVNVLTTIGVVEPAGTISGPVSGAGAVIPTPVVAPVVRSIAYRTPPAAAVPSSISAETDAESKPSGAMAEAEAPSIPWIPTDVEAPGRWSWIVIMTPPGPVIPSGTVDDTPVIDVTVYVSGVVPHIDH